MHDVGGGLAAGGGSGALSVDNNVFSIGLRFPPGTSCFICEETALSAYVRSIRWRSSTCSMRSTGPRAEQLIISCTASPAASPSHPARCQAALWMLAHSALPSWLRGLGETTDRPGCIYRTAAASILFLYGHQPGDHNRRPYARSCERLCSHCSLSWP